MNWSDERYVRLYTRDTTEWTMWPWESRALLPLLLRKMDRCGVLSLGKYGTKGLASLLSVPADFAERGVEGLLEDGCLVRQGDVLVMRNFIAAQESSSSLAKRSREWRERQRDSAGNESDQDRNKTLRDRNEMCRNRNDAQRDATDHNESQRRATPSLAVPSRAEPSLAVPQIPLSVSTDRGVEQPTPFHQEPTDGATASGEARAVFDHWCAVMQKGGKTSFDSKRRAKVNARLKDGYTVEQLKRAIDGCALTPHNMGQNDRGEKYNDLELICRDAAHVDRFIQNADKPPVAKVGNDISQAAKSAFERVGFIHDF